MIEYSVGECTFYAGTPLEKVLPCVYVDGKPIKIQETKEGYKYFEIENPFISKDADTSVENELARIFHNRICDAIRAVREGYAHCLYNDGKFFNSSYPRPIVMLDSARGEEFRLKTLEGFKDCEFGYSIKFDNKNSMYASDFVSVKGNRGVSFEDDFVDFFKDMGSAQAKVNDYIESAKLLASGKTLSELMRVGQDEEVRLRSVVFRLALEICKRGVDGMFDQYSFEIVQNIR